VIDLIGTVALTGDSFKQLFECFAVLSAGGCRKSLRRSIELLFEPFDFSLEGVMGDIVDAVDRRICALHGRVGAARVRVGVRGRRIPATAHAYARGRGRRPGDLRPLRRYRSSVVTGHAGQSAAAPAEVVVTRGPLRLTRRGQLVLVALAAVVALAVAGFLMSRTGGAATQRPEPVGQRSIVVQPGQTLWSIAKDVAPDRDIRQVIYEIRRINGLDSAMVRSGQTIVLPAG